MEKYQKNLRLKTPTKSSQFLFYINNKKEISKYKNNRNLMNISDIYNTYNNSKDFSNGKIQNKSYEHNNIKKNIKISYNKEKVDNYINKYLKNETKKYEKKTHHPKLSSNFRIYNTKSVTNFKKIVFGDFRGTPRISLNKTIFQINEEKEKEIEKQFNIIFKGSNKSNKEFNIKYNDNDKDNINENLNIIKESTQKKKSRNCNNKKINNVESKLTLDKNKLEIKTKDIDIGIKRFNTIKNYNRDQLPSDLNIFNQSNLFNSSLLMIINIFYVKNYITKNEYKIKKQYSKNNKSCLTNILLNINENLKNYIRNKNINLNKNDYSLLLNLYNNYIEWFSKKYLKRIILIKS